MTWFFCISFLLLYVKIHHDKGRHLFKVFRWNNLLILLSNNFCLLPLRTTYFLRKVNQVSVKVLPCTKFANNVRNNPTITPGELLTVNSRIYAAINSNFNYNCTSRFFHGKTYEIYRFGNETLHADALSELDEQTFYDGFTARKIVTWNIRTDFVTDDYLREWKMVNEQGCRWLNAPTPEPLC